MGPAAPAVTTRNGSGSTSLIPRAAARRRRGGAVRPGDVTDASVAAWAETDPARLRLGGSLGLGLQVA